MKQSWYSIRNVKDDSAEICLYDEIGLFGVTAKTFLSELKGLGDRRITLRINSPGGSVFEGNVIYNALRRHSGGVDVCIDGLAASMASVIAMVGERRSMAANAMLMIHNPAGVVMGDSDEFRRNADLLDKIKENIVTAYESATGLNREDLSQMMDEETWLTATEAKQFGFITEIVEETKMAANFERFDLSAFKNPPTDFLTQRDEGMNKAFFEKLVAALTPENKEIKPDDLFAKIEEIQNLAASIAGKEAEIATLTNLVATKDSEITSYTAKISEHVSTIAERDASITNLTAERDGFKANLDTVTAQRDNLKKAHGLAPANEVPEIESAGKTTDAQLLDTFNKISDPVASARFWNEHKEALVRASQP